MAHVQAAVESSLANGTGHVSHSSRSTIGPLDELSVAIANKRSSQDAIAAAADAVTAAICRDQASRPVPTFSKVSSFQSAPSLHPQWRGAPWVHVAKSPDEQAAAAARQQQQQLYPRHRSAPQLHSSASFMAGHGAADPLRPWRQNSTKLRYNVNKVVVRGERKAPLVWRPVGNSEGHPVTSHVAIAQGPPPPADAAVRNCMRNETDLAALLAAAHVQLAEQRQQASLVANESDQRVDILRAEHLRECAALRQQLEVETQAKERAEQRLSEIEAKFSDTKDGRVEAYHKKALKRLLRSDLSKGWTQWVAMYEGKLYNQALARKTQAMMFHVKPTVRAAFALWRCLRESKNSQSKNKDMDDLGAEVCALWRVENFWRSLRRGDDCLAIALLALTATAPPYPLTPPGATRAYPAQVRDLEEQLLASRAETEGLRESTSETIAMLQQQVESLSKELERREQALVAQGRVEKAERVSILTEQAARRFKLAGLVRGWTTWLAQHREYSHKMAQAKMLQQVRQRLMKPGLADPFILWKQWWEHIVASKVVPIKTADELLLEEAGLRRCLQEENGTLAEQLGACQQQVKLSEVALRDERKALAAARAELHDLRRLEVQARDSLSKRRSTEQRFKDLAKSQADAMATLEAERKAAKERLDAQKGLAASELKRLLRDQRSALESMMTEALAEAERRAAMAEQMARDDTRLLAEQYAAALALANERANLGLEPTATPKAPRLPEGPHLHTRDRSAVWAEELANREAAGLRATDPWHDRYGAEEFRAIRRAPSKLAKYFEAQPAWQQGVAAVMGMQATSLAAAAAAAAALQGGGAEGSGLGYDQGYDGSAAESPMHHPDSPDGSAAAQRGSTDTNAITASLLAQLDARHAQEAKQAETLQQQQAAAREERVAAIHAAAELQLAEALGTTTPHAPSTPGAASAPHVRPSASTPYPAARGDALVDKVAAGHLLDRASSKALSARAADQEQDQQPTSRSLQPEGDDGTASAGSRPSSVAPTPSSQASRGARLSSSKRHSSTRSVGFGSDTHEPGARAALSGLAAGAVTKSTRGLPLGDVNVLNPSSPPTAHGAPSSPSSPSKTLLETVVGSSASLLRASPASSLPPAVAPSAAPSMAKVISHRAPPKMPTGRR